MKSFLFPSMDNQKMEDLPILSSSHWGEGALNLLNSLKSEDISDYKEIIIILRHSAREEPEIFEMIAGANLTEEGKKGAAEFGKNLPKCQRITLSSSQSQRCRDTAKIIINAAEKEDQNVEYFSVWSGLGEIGGEQERIEELCKRDGGLFPFYWTAGIYEPEEVEPSMLIVERIFSAYFDEIPKADPSNPYPGLHICVTHDFQLTTMFFHLTGKHSWHKHEEWINYLEGFIILRDSRKKDSSVPPIKILYRDQVLTPPVPFWWPFSEDK